MDIPNDDGQPLDRLFEWFKAEVRRTPHGTVFLEVEIQGGKVVNAHRGAKKSERFPFKARK